MLDSFFTPVYSALYKKINTFGVSSKFFAIEMAIIGMCAFVIKIYSFIALVIIAHIIIAILNKKESNWQEILKFLIKVPDEEY